MDFGRSNVKTSSSWEATAEALRWQKLLALAETAYRGLTAKSSVQLLKPMFTSSLEDNKHDCLEHQRESGRKNAMTPHRTTGAFKTPVPVGQVLPLASCKTSTRMGEASNWRKECAVSAELLDTCHQTAHSIMMKSLQWNGRDQERAIQK